MTVVARSRSMRAFWRSPRTYLGVYLTMLATVVFWPTHVDQGAARILAMLTRMIPPLTYPRIEFFANVALFVPFSFLLALLLRRHRWQAISISMLTSLLIEVVQGAALAGRTASVFDILANTAGAAAGTLVAVSATSRRSVRGRGTQHIDTAAVSDIESARR